METLAIIPARGGSKGLPGKNILPLNGKPLIAHTIESAQQAQHVSRVIVSTDDNAIAKTAKAYGAEIPFLRPAEISDDLSPGIDVCLHALQHMRDQQNYSPDIVILLQPTSPLRTAEDIDAAIDLMLQQNADSIVGLKPVTEYPQWMKKLSNDHRISPFFKDLHIASTRQELDQAYLLNGAIYASKTGPLVENKGFYNESTCGYVMPEDRSIDIDTAHDLIFAETILNQPNR